MPRPEPLGVWLDGLLVAELAPRRPWELHCKYTELALTRWPRLSPVLSCSLPLRDRPMNAGVFADGLLPEGRHRQALSAELKVAVNDVYSLLRRFGRDVAGALVIATEEPTPRTPEAIPYTDESLEQEVIDLPDRPLAIHDDSELSIAGLQDKLLLVRMPDGAAGPRPTHGLSLQPHPQGGRSATAGAELRPRQECLRTRRPCGPSRAIDVQTRTIAEKQCLIVSRFDRRIDTDGAVTRIHQEDLCQALARGPDAARGRGKYIRTRADRPCTRLRCCSIATPQNRRNNSTGCLPPRTFTVLIGNADAHGKNLALVHPTAETVEFAPLYDTVPTILWPRLRRRGAMSVGGRWELESITLENFLDEGGSWRLARERARKIVLETAERLRDVTIGLEADSAPARYVTERAGRLLSEDG